MGTKKKNGANPWIPYTMLNLWLSSCTYALQDIGRINWKVTGRRPLQYTVWILGLHFPCTLLDAGNEWKMSYYSSVRYMHDFGVFIPVLYMFADCITHFNQYCVFSFFERITPIKDYFFLCNFGWSSKNIKKKFIVCICKFQHNVKKD